MLGTEREPLTFVMVPVPEELEDAIQHRLFQLVLADAVDRWELPDLEQFWAETSEDEARLLSALIPGPGDADAPGLAELAEKLEMSEDEVEGLIDSVNVRAMEAGPRSLVLEVPGVKVGNHELPPSLVVPRKASAMLAEIIDRP